MKIKQGFFYLTIVIVLFFIFSVILRKQWFGIMSEDGHHWITAHSLLISRQWYSESPLTFKFGLPWNPASVEFATVDERGYYYSYPSGIIWPIYLISKVINKLPSLSLIMIYNLVNHFLVAITLSLISYIILVRSGISKTKSLLTSLLSSLMVIFLPGPFYWFQNVYFADIAVILPYSLLLLLQVIKSYSVVRNNKFLNIAEFLIILYSLFTDWLSVFIVFTLLGINFIFSDKKLKSFIKNNTHILAAITIFVILFSYQTFLLSGFSHLYERLVFRSGASESGSKHVTNFFYQFWMTHAYKAYTFYGLLLFLTSLILYIYNFIAIIARPTNIKEFIGLTKIFSLALVPSILEVYALKNHSAIHEFSALKFIVPISLSIPFIISTLKLKFEKNILDNSVTGLNISSSSNQYKIKIPIFIIILLFVASWLITEKSKYSYFPIPSKTYNDISELIFTNTNYNDVVFSPNYQIPTIPPQRLSLSLKRVYFYSEISEIYKKLNRVDSENVVLNLLVIGNNYQDEGLNKLITKAFSSKTFSVNSDQKDQLISEIYNMPDVNSSVKEKSIKSISDWDNNLVHLYKIKL